MRKIMIGLTVTAIALVIAASVYAFSLSLSHLRLSASALVPAGVSGVEAASMSNAAESAIGKDVPFATVNLTLPEGTCHRDKVDEDRLGF